MCAQFVHLEMGVWMTGPRPLMMSNSMPSAGRGVRMSLNMMTPSGRNARQGCRDSSVAMSAFSDRSLKGSRSEYLHAAEEPSNFSCLFVFFSYKLERYLNINISEYNIQCNNASVEGRNAALHSTARFSKRGGAGACALSELWHVAPGLPHEPHRRPLRIWGGGMERPP